MRVEYKTDKWLWGSFSLVLLKLILSENRPFRQNDRVWVIWSIKQTFFMLHIWNRWCHNNWLAHKERINELYNGSAKGCTNNTEEIRGKCVKTLWSEFPSIHEEQAVIISHSKLLQTWPGETSSPPLWSFFSPFYKHYSLSLFSNVKWVLYLYATKMYFLAFLQSIY